MANSDELFHYWKKKEIKNQVNGRNRYFPEKNEDFAKLHYSNVSLYSRNSYWFYHSFLFNAGS